MLEAKEKAIRHAGSMHLKARWLLVDAKVIKMFSRIDLFGFHFW